MDLQKIGACLHELRKEKGLTQAQVAERFGVSGKTVSRWENGVHMPDLEILLEIADFYEIDLRALLNGEAEKDKTAPEMPAEVKDAVQEAAEYSEKRNVQFRVLQQKHAMRLSIASLLIGICTVPGYVLLVIVLAAMVDSLDLLAFMSELIIAIVSFAGLLLGIIALIKSIHVKLRTKECVTFSVLGIINCSLSVGWMVSYLVKLI